MIRLTLGRMFEATVRNRSHELVLEQKVAETGRVDADVAALLVASSITSGKTALCRSRTTVGGRLGGLDLLVGVVNEILLVRHGGLCVGSKGGCRFESVVARVASEAEEQSRVASVPRS
jgi:hypothetical protein